MQSWNLKTFVAANGINAAVKVWGKSRQAVEQALLKDRDIQIVKLDGFYEVHEYKLLNKIAIDEVRL
jgi:hypothetical protein